jgi:hypothetical protein
MAQPTLNGRLLPPQDWEGDDVTPGAGGAYVTCQDTAAGRMLYYSSNGACDLDGKTIRAAIRPPQSDGVSLPQVAGAIASLTSPSRILQSGQRNLVDIRGWLSAGLGLVIDGYYGAIPAPYRHQAFAGFNHALWISNYEPPNYRVWDPLNRDLSSFGEWIPSSAIDPFIRSLSGLCGWITLEPIAPPAQGNPMLNLVPMTVHRVVQIPGGTKLYKIPGGDVFTTLPQTIKLGFLGATSTFYCVADGDYGVYLDRATKGLVVLTEDKNVGI